MERRPAKSPLEIRKAADRIMRSAIERKKSRGEPLLPDEEVYAGKIDAAKRSAEDRESQNATAMAEYVKRYPSFEVFEAAVKRAAGAFQDIEDTAVEKSARNAAQREGLLEGLPSPALQGGIIVSVIAFHSLHPDMARASAKVVYERLILANS